MTLLVVVKFSEQIVIFPQQLKDWSLQWRCGVFCEVGSLLKYYLSCVILQRVKGQKTPRQHLRSVFLWDNGFLTLEDGTNGLSQNSGKELPLYPA